MILSSKQQHISTYLRNARSRARRDNVPFSLTKEYLLSIATDECPIFHTPFEWGVSGLGKGNTKDNCPTLDRILPELGYVEGNVAFLSHRANRIKDNGTMQEHYAIADWIWNHTHAKQKSATPVSARDHQESSADAKYGAVPSTRFGQVSNSVDHHSGTIQGQDIDHSPQASSGDSVGHGVQEMESLIVAQSIEATWPREPKVIWIKNRGRHIPN